MRYNRQAFDIGGTCRRQKTAAEKSLQFDKIGTGGIFLKKEYDEKALVAKARKGSSEAFGVLVRQTQLLVYNLALRMTKNEQDALDMSQEAYIKAWKSISKFEGNCSFSSWMYTITRNVCIDHAKKMKGRGTLSLTVDDGEGERCELALASDDGPEKIYEQKERVQAARDAIEKLSDIQREVIILCDIEGFSYKETALTLGIEEGTVKSRLFRAREKLHQILKSREHL